MGPSPILPVIHIIPSGGSQDFSDGGANPRAGNRYTNLIFGKICAENCMKMKEFRPGGTRP